jgi:hypothetical protein
LIEHRRLIELRPGALLPGEKSCARELERSFAPEEESLSGQTVSSRGRKGRQNLGAPETATQHT